MNYTFTQRFQVTPIDSDRLLEQCDRIMNELLDLEAAHEIADPSIGGAMARGQVEISVMVQADSYVEAVQKAMTVIRSAIHAAGGGTPDWPQLDDAAVRSIEAEAVQAEVPIGV